MNINKRYIAITLCLWSTIVLNAKKINAIYDKTDSIKIEKILEKAKQYKGAESRMIFFGKQFVGVPYVASTLEVSYPNEKLIVNTRQMDCTTFVETVLALTICDNQGKRTFADYCRALEYVRYRSGKNQGYGSRLHYFAFWVKDGISKGTVRDVLQSETQYTTIQTLDLHFMTEHQDKYVFLKDNKKLQQEINYWEEAINGEKIRYIQKKYFTLPPNRLKNVKTGDIIGLVTKKKGLDTTHLGIAVWKNGKLHLMNASSIRKKVVVETQTLAEYSKKQTSQIGIRIVRPSMSFPTIK